MTRCIVLVCAAILSTVVSAQSPAGPPVVFFTIFGPPGSELQRFYTEVFGWEIAPDGNAMTNVMSPLGAREGDGQRRHDSLSALRIAESYRPRQAAAGEDD